MCSNDGFAFPVGVSTCFPTRLHACNFCASTHVFVCMNAVRSMYVCMDYVHVHIQVCILGCTLMHMGAFAIVFAGCVLSLRCDRACVHALLQLLFV